MLVEFKDYTARRFYQHFLRSPPITSLLHLADIIELAQESSALDESPGLAVH